MIYVKLNEFGQRIGVPLTKLRYYARYGVIQPERCENNYRELTDSEAIDVYSALILRDFDISVEEISKIHQCKSEVDLFTKVDCQVDDLQERINHLQLHLDRLKELQDFLDKFENPNKSAFVYRRVPEYVLWSFSDDFQLNAENQKKIEELTACSPFSYIALRVKEHVWKTQELFKPELGVAILKKNIKKCNLEVPKDVVYTNDTKLITYCHVKENMFEITREDIQPLFDKANEMDVELMGDLTGRFYLCSLKNGKRLYCFVLGCEFREKNILT